MALDTSMPVLVVDDYNTMVRIIKNLLRQLGFADQGLELAVPEMRRNRHAVHRTDGLDRLRQHLKH